MSCNPGVLAFNRIYFYIVKWHFQLKMHALWLLNSKPGDRFTHLWDFLPSIPPGPEPQSWAWMMKVYSFCSSQSTRLRALSWPSPDVPFSTTASNGASKPWMLNAQISPRKQREGRLPIKTHPGHQHIYIFSFSRFFFNPLWFTVEEQYSS